MTNTNEAGETALLKTDDLGQETGLLDVEN